MVLNAAGHSTEDMKKLLTARLSDCVEVTGQTREDVIVRLLGGVTRKQLLQRLAGLEELDLEHFETYKPSLNDIFVAKVGEEA